MQHATSSQLLICGLGMNFPPHTLLTAQVFAMPLLDVGRKKAAQPRLSVTATPPITHANIQTCRELEGEIRPHGFHDTAKEEKC